METISTGDKQKLKIVLIIYEPILASNGCRTQLNKHIQMNLGQMSLPNSEQVHQAKDNGNRKYIMIFTKKKKAVDSPTNDATKQKK